MPRLATGMVIRTAPVEKVSWGGCPSLSDQRLATNSRQVTCLQAGPMCYPPNRNGNMPAVRVRPRLIHGEIASPARMRIITGTAVEMTDDSQTRDVGSNAANPWGFFDMHGNVWEWTADFNQTAYPTGNPVIDPTLV